MAFIFRLHPNGANTNTDWSQSQPYGTNVISQIVAPNGASAKTEITSIPSPFARIALVKSAFEEVVKTKNLNGHRGDFPWMPIPQGGGTSRISS